MVFFLVDSFDISLSMQLLDPFEEATNSLQKAIQTLRGQYSQEFEALKTQKEEFLKRSQEIETYDQKIREDHNTEYLKISLMQEEIAAERKTLEEDKKKMEELQNKMKEISKKAKSKVKLNVGGKIFMTSLTTLTSIPGFFQAMFSGNFNVEPDDDGEFFIDRNPKHFEMILDYLRTGSMDTEDLTPREMKELLKELAFYGITQDSENGPKQVLYVTGGENSPEKVERFVEGKWETVAPMIQGRRLHASVALGKDLYVLGGADDKNILLALSSVERYDSKTNTWYFVASMSSPRKNFTAVSLKNRIYVTGGTSAVEYYDPENDRWNSLPPMKENRSLHAMVVLNEQIYVIGGSWMLTSTSSVEKYDPVSNQWTNLAPMLNARCGLGAAVLSGKIYVAGGKKGDNSVEVYDPSTNQWNYAMSMNRITGMCKMVTHGGKLYAFANESLDVESYDPKTNSWSPGFSLNEKKRNSAMAVILEE